MNKKQYIIHVITSILVVLLISFLVAGRVVPDKGHKAPNILLYDINKKQFNLRKLDYNGMILISFSATYCKPCKEEIKELERLQENKGKDKIKIYLIFVDPKSEDVKAYIKKNNVKLSVLHDKYKFVFQKYGIEGLPTSFLLDKDDIIIHKIRGYNKKSLKIMQKLIK